MDKLNLPQGTKLPIQPKPSLLDSFQANDKTKLLMLGLQLLSKSLKVPCAVVPPQQQAQPTPAPTTTIVNRSPPSSPYKNSLTEMLSGSEDSDQGSPENPRKRKRTENTELTEKEKREKRKMMNRVAAQNARDRKKNYVEDLEKKVALLERQNKHLQSENLSLKQTTSVLTSEKEQLELCLADTLQTDLLDGLVKRVCPKETPTYRSAAPGVVSLQQKQILRANLLQVWMSISLTFWLTSFKKANVPQLSLPALEQVLDLEWSQLPANDSQLLRVPQWWGASDSKWNPPRN